MNNSGRFTRNTIRVNGPCWLIFTDALPDNAGRRLLKLRLRGVGNVLPVFGSEEDALHFLRGIPGRASQSLAEIFGTEVSRPEVLRASRARLASALSTTLNEVDVVTFDPLPEPDFIDTLRLASMPRRSFVDLLLGRDRRWSDCNAGKSLWSIGVAASSAVNGSS